MTKTLRLFLSLAVTLALAAGVSAQSSALLVKIPFDFYVDNTVMTSGTYVVSLTDSGHVLQVSGKDRHSGVFSMTNPGSPPAARNKNALVFNRYGNQYFLAKVISYSSGLELLKTKAEREAAKSKRDLLTMKDAEPEIITVNAQIGQ